MDLRSIRSGWSKESFLRWLRDALERSQARLRKEQQRYKRDFEKHVASVHRRLKPGDQAFLDICGTEAEKTCYRRSGDKLDPKPSFPTPHSRTMVPPLYWIRMGYWSV